MGRDGGQVIKHREKQVQTASERFLQTKGFLSSPADVCSRCFPRYHCCPADNVGVSSCAQLLKKREKGKIKDTLGVLSQGGSKCTHSNIHIERLLHLMCVDTGRLRPVISVEVILVPVTKTPKFQ